MTFEMQFHYLIPDVDFSCASEALHMRFAGHSMV